MMFKWHGDTETCRRPQQENIQLSVPSDSERSMQQQSAFISFGKVLDQVPAAGCSLHAGGAAAKPGTNFHARPPRPPRGDRGRGAMMAPDAADIIAILLHRGHKVEATCRRKPGMTSRSHDMDRNTERERKRRYLDHSCSPSSEERTHTHRVRRDWPKQPPPVSQ